MPPAESARAGASKTEGGEGSQAKSSWARTYAQSPY